MKELFKVAQNTFAITAPDNLTVREALMRRYGPFADNSDDERPVLEVTIREDRLPETEGETIYKPEFDGIGFITSRASCLGDGSLVIEFSHVSEEKPRLWMRMSRSMDRSEIVMDPKNVDEDVYFLTHALMISYMLATTGNGTLLIHASAVTFDGKAYLFQGKSGTGKSTHSRLWVENIAGAEPLNDDHPVIRIGADGTPMAYGSPWSGKTHCYRNAGAEIGAFVRIVRGAENELKGLAPLNSYASLTASMFYLPFLGEEQREVRHRTIERLAREIPCCEMHCRPDKEAALTCMKGVTNIITTKIK
ncbi:MAG: hypothetical protein K2H87_01035 [Duncaniella sp.]|nr:hypothetical protein [Duncaniella sp.]